MVFAQVCVCVGWGYSHVLFIRGLGPTIYCLPPQNYLEYQAYTKIFENLATPQNIHFLYIDTQERP